MAIPEMFNYIEKLKNKSSAERNRIAIITSIFGTFFIVFVWFLAGNFGFEVEKKIIDSEKKEDGVSLDGASPFVVVKNAFSELVGTFKNVESSVGEFRKSLDL